jgi:hypothetical protein
MIAQGSASGMGVRRFSRPRRGVGVLAMPDAGLDTTQRIQSVCDVPAGSGVPSMADGAFINRPCVGDLVEVTG